MIKGYKSRSSYKTTFEWVQTDEKALDYRRTGKDGVIVGKNSFVPKGLTVRDSCTFEIKYINFGPYYDEVKLRFNGRLSYYTEIEFEIFILDDENQKHSIVQNKNWSNYNNEYLITWGGRITNCFKLPGNPLTLKWVVTVSNPSGYPAPHELNILPPLNNKLKNLFLSGTDSDFTFNVGERKFHVHKFILKLRSDVFKVMLQTEMNEKMTNEATLSTTDPSIFEKMLKFIYADEIDVENSGDAMELLKIAHKYEIKDLFEMCVSILCDVMTVNNVMNILSLAKLYDIQRLITSSKKYIHAHKIDISEYHLKEMLAHLEELYYRMTQFEEQLNSAMVRIKINGIADNIQNRNKEH